MKERILWTINVYSRVDQLKQQEHMIKSCLPDIPIMVFCNNENVMPDYREDFLETTKVNSGHHTGVRDAHNAVLPYLKDYDVIISSHADCFFMDWTTPLEIVEKMRREGKKMAQLGPLQNWNTHKNQNQPYTFNDFFVLDARIWEKMGKITDFCDDDEGIECTLARWVRHVITDDDVLVVPAKDVRGYDTPPPHMFQNVLGKPGNDMLRENNTEAKNEYLSRVQPHVFKILKEHGLA